MVMIENGRSLVQQFLDRIICNPTGCFGIHTQDVVGTCESEGAEVAIAFTDLTQSPVDSFIEIPRAWVGVIPNFAIPAAACAFVWCFKFVIICSVVWYNNVVSSV